MRRIVLLLPALCIGLYFFGFAGWGLRADFTQDDLQNMYWSLPRTYPDLIKDNLMFWRFSLVYRPFCGLLYKLSLDCFGLNLTALSVLRYAVMCANLFLLYALARRLAGSREVGVLAALILTYHRAFGSLYFNTGTIYDIFCFFFFFAALLYYVRVRQSGRQLGALHLLAFLVLVVLALDSKEMALALPLIVGLYELLYHTPGSIRAWVAPLLSGVIATAYYFGRVASKDGIAHIGAYQPVISLAEYVKQTGHYLNELVHKPDSALAPHLTVLFLLLLFLGAALLRSRVLAFSALLFAVGILPVAFILWRGLNAVYIPLAGLAIYAAVLLVKGRELLSRWLRWPVAERDIWGLTLGRILLFVLVAAVLMRVHVSARGDYTAWKKDAYADIRAIMDQLPQLHPKLGKSDRILIVRDPFKQANWATLFIARLVYRNEWLTVDRLASMRPKPTAAEIAKYEIRLAYEDGKLRDVSPSEVPLVSP